MRLAVTVVSPVTGRQADVIIDAGPGTPVADVAVELDRLLHGQAADPPPEVFVSFERMAGQAPLNQSLIRDGVVISLGDPSGCVPPQAVGAAEIRVAGGPAAGAVYRLPFGEFDLGGGYGRGPAGHAAAHVVIADPAIPPSAVRIAITPDGFGVAPFEAAGVLLDRLPLDGPAYWTPGQQLATGETLLEICGYEPPDAALRVRPGNATVELSRPHRRLPPRRVLTFELPAPPRGRAFRAEYHDMCARVEDQARAAFDAERLRRRHDCPDPATAFAIGTGPRRRLWERRRTDPDYLLLRVGTAHLPADTQLAGAARQWLIPDAPVTIPLAERHVAGLCGPAEAPRAAGRWLVAQIAVLHSPQDVQIVILTDNSGQQAWEWARWLPHCRPAEEQNCVGLIGTDAETVTARIAELQAIIAAGRRTHDIVVIFDGSRRLRSLPGVTQILRDGGGAGVYSLCLDAEEHHLPAECRAAVVLRPDGQLTVRQASGPCPVVGWVQPEHVTPDWCDLLARTMAPIRDADGDAATAALPDACRLLGVLGLEPPSVSAIAARWGRSTSAVLGESYDGSFGIDIRGDGPHALIAGARGAGKSELLRTLIASLAVVNRPDAMNFVLIDCEGGGAFGECAQLPHVVALVTDLDAHLSQRALVSLSAELTRRERIFAGAGAKDLEGYTARHRAGHAPEPVPRLVIVIDEFASLARDLPEFVSGLAGIAQRGRSLGLHLVLATERPSGAVSAEISAIMNLRIALRVADATESADVIGAPDAARISRATPGRGYVRLGSGSLVPFQAGSVGAASAADPRPWVAAAGWPSLGRPEPRRPGGDAELTDLRLLVGAVQRSASRLRVPAQRSPWLAPLPAVLLLPGIAGHGTGRADEGEITVPFGLNDLPGSQQQLPAVLRLNGCSHLLAAGGPRSGRSQLLVTLAASVAVNASAAEVHLYGIDCGDGALAPVADLPHCGAVVPRAQEERIARLVEWLAAELDRRQAECAAGSLPRLVVLLDRWEGCGEGELADIVPRILAEGASGGMHLVMTADLSVLTGPIAALCEDKLVFGSAGLGGLGGLGGLRAREVPADVPPGRAFWAANGSQVQVALLGADASGPAQAAALREIGTWARSLDADLPPSSLPFPADTLPPRIAIPA